MSQHTDIAGCARHTEHKEPLERNSTPTKISNILVLPPSGMKTEDLSFDDSMFLKDTDGWVGSQAAHCIGK